MTSLAVVHGRLQIHNDCFCPQCKRRTCTCRTGLTRFAAEWRMALVSLALVRARVSYLLVVLCTPSVRPSVCRPSIS